MKKLFAILVAILFAATFSFAQNTSTVTETGSSNTHMVDQTGSNTSTITQEALTGAKNNNASVTQNGATNTAIQNQHQ